MDVLVYPDRGDGLFRIPAETFCQKDPLKFHRVTNSAVSVDELNDASALVSLHVIRRPGISSPEG